ncbi:MAG: ligase-associated DNA damage response endonuclease PdeM [Verrucomicrobiaceae bacterium]|nr:MAG: ligase-associated DNA damage response endonuclease PdeM [Verrucomicrobiaceae bacterium]
MTPRVSLNPPASHFPLRLPSGVTVHLLPGRAVLLPGNDPWLVVADVHLGKSAAFRARGLAVPEGDTAQDLAAMLDLVRLHQPARLVVNGDLFHAPSGLTAELEEEVERFVGSLGIPLALVMGNHDAKISRLPTGVRQVSCLEHESGVRLVHDPAEAAPAESDGRFQFHIAGHWHPAVRIADGRRTTLRLPCFLLRGPLLILPSFGSFTGGASMRPEPGDRFFVAPGERVMEVPGALLR